uniref:Anti-proliferative protein domain-containing protein n=1 Tax=Electrophorus electricus TaxID=8005 RepID=A0AAY5F2Z2_ELEEL
MHLEVKVALNFIVSYLYNKLPRRRADLFGEELERILVSRFEGHWYPEAPLRGSAFRCLHLGVPRDPVVDLAARRSGLDTEEVRANVPPELSIWIDPYEVSYQIGEKGAVKVLYMEDPPGLGGEGGPPESVGLSKGEVDRSPTTISPPGLVKHKPVSLSMHSLSGQVSSQLSPDAKEFVYPASQGPLYFDAEAPP